MIACCHPTVIIIRGDSYRLRKKRSAGLLQKVGTMVNTNETANNEDESNPHSLDTLPEPRAGDNSASDTGGIQGQAKPAGLHFRTARLKPGVSTAQRSDCAPGRFCGPVRSPLNLYNCTGCHSVKLGLQWREIPQETSR
ncbi:MAG: hypothetical protein E5V66_05310 [Mesorhizobium sp.]|nr:MAG: hypothetical protein E5V66_05310 [Mesorhizobium sp.]TJX76295.1 MAG: hypothetical protein E5W21_03960 [Mesorhizobium sp.]